MRLPPLLLAALLLVTVAGAGEKPVEDLVRELVRPRTRYAAYRELLRRKDPRALPLLERILPALDTGGQYLGVIIVQSYPRPLSIPSLRRLLSAKSPYLRVAAGSSLYLRGEKSAARAAADALLAPGVPDATRLRMLARLYAVRDPATRAAVRSLLCPGMNAAVCWSALYLLHLQRDTGAGRAATRLLPDRRPEVRALAAAFLVRIGFPGRPEEVAASIRDRDLPALLWSRIRLLLNAAARCPRPILDALVTRLGFEKDPKALAQEAALLGRFRHRPGADALQGLLRREEPTVVTAAFDALLSIPGILTPEKLAPLLDAKGAWLRLKAADALRRYDDPAGFSAAVDILKGGKPAERAEAAKVVGEFRRSAAVDPLIEALLDPDQATRTNALAGLTRILAFLFPYRRLNLPLTGYAPAAPEAIRRAAVDTLRTWWKVNRAKDW